MLFRQQGEAVAHFVELPHFLQNFVCGHEPGGLPGAFNEAGAAFTTAASHLH
jgi:hypothetical protein